ncbi:MAG: hypothetical protein CMM47_01405 [Rhodospirillaceae bacterium]|nr:hypothetical protein [Rhodospirillaceae bacterium]
MKNSFNRLGERTTSAFSRLFRDRELILRSGGRVHYFACTRRFQHGLLASLVVFLTWVGFASVGYFKQTALINEKNQAIWRAQDSYRELLDQVSDYQLSIVSITRDLKETQSHLHNLFDQNESLKNTLYSTEAALKLSQVERDRINKGRRALNDQFDLLGKEVRRMTGKNNALQNHIGNLRDHLENARAEKAELAAERKQMGDRLWELNNDLQGSIMHGENLEATIHSLRSDLRTAMIEKGLVVDKNDTLRKRLASLETTLADQVDSHSAQLRKISERALRNIHVLESVLRNTGLDLERIAPLPEGTIMGKGGPFIPYHPDMRHMQGDDNAAEVDLSMHLDRWERLRDVVAGLPFIAPIKGGYITSRYGRRKDPFTKRWAMHKGLDLGGQYKTPVRATASGKVVFAGRRPYYGRTIDIQHANGIMTRYAHLYKITIKRGEAVERGDEIGLLGSSGRSTGPHVHYEIRHMGKAYNPRKFLRAVNNVQ